MSGGVGIECVRVPCAHPSLSHTFSQGISNSKPNPIGKGLFPTGAKLFLHWFEQRCSIMTSSDLSSPPRVYLKFSVEYFPERESEKLKSKYVVKFQGEKESTTGPSSTTKLWQKDVNLSHFHLSIHTVTSRFSTTLKSQLSSKNILNFYGIRVSTIQGKFSD